MFAGETEYKSNVILQFGAAFTLRRYKADRFARLRFHIRSYLAIAALVWALMYIFVKPVRLLAAFLGVAAVLASYFFCILHRSATVGRAFLLISEAVFRVELFRSWTMNQCPVQYMLMFNVPTFLSGIRALATIVSQ